MTTMSWSQSFRIVRRNVLADTKEEADAKFREYLLSEEFAEYVKNAGPMILVPPGQIKDDDDLDFTDEEVDEIGAVLDKQRLLAMLLDEVMKLDTSFGFRQSVTVLRKSDVLALIEKAGGE